MRVMYLNPSYDWRKEDTICPVCHVRRNHTLEHSRELRAGLVLHTLKERIKQQDYQLRALLGQ